MDNFNVYGNKILDKIHLLALGELAPTFVQ